MSLLEEIVGEIGQGGMAKIGDAIGAGPDQTRSAVSTALPMLLGGLARNAKSDEGASSLASALERDHEPSLESQIQSASSGGGLAGALGGLLGGGGQSSGGGGLGSMLGAAVSAMGQGSGGPKALDGAGILGHILGGKQGRVEQGVAKASGMDSSMVAKLLPVLAPIVMSALANLKKKKGLDASGLSGALQEEQAGLEQQAGRGGFMDLLDADDDGSAMDEIASIGGALVQSGALGKLFG